MAAVMEYVIGSLTAVCTSLIVVVLLWRLTRVRTCCDVINLIAWLLDVCQALMGAAILILVVSNDLSCAVAGFLTTFGGTQTLCLLATRGVVMAIGHVDKEGYSGCRKMENKHCKFAVVSCIVLVFSLVTIFCALPLSQLPVSTTSHFNNSHHHLTCLPLALGKSRDAAWQYSCFLLVALVWLPLLVAMATEICRPIRRKDGLNGGSAVFWASVARLLLWTLIVVLLSVEVLSNSVSRPGRRDAIQLVLVLAVDVAILTHFIHDILSVRQRHHKQTQQQQQLQLPARLTAVTRAQQLQVCLRFVSSVQCNYLAKTVYF